MKISTDLYARLSVTPHFLTKLDDTAQRTNENICIQISLMGFVDDDDRVSAEQEIRGHLAKQNTICHKLDDC